MSESRGVAFEVFLDRHGPALARLAHQLTGSHDASLDLVQDVLERVLAKWEKVAAAEHPAAYLRRMTVNTHLNGTRRRLRTGHESPEPVVPDPTASVPEADELWQALAALPARQRAALVLRYYEDCPDDEIAAVLGCRRATVRSLVARGLAALRATGEFDRSTA